MRDESDPHFIKLPDSAARGLLITGCSCAPAYSRRIMAHSRRAARRRVHGTGGTPNKKQQAGWKRCSSMELTKTGGRRALA